MTMSWLISVVLVCTYYKALALSEPPMLEIESGLISGKVKYTWSGRTVFGFEGIPYATPPVGPLRFQVSVYSNIFQTINIFYLFLLTLPIQVNIIHTFQDAKPVKPWLGVWNATEPGSKCIQYDHEKYQVLGEEDCLYVNVYTPKVSALVNIAAMFLLTLLKT